MKDLFIITLVVLLFWLVESWLDIAWADVIVDNNTIWIITKVFSF